MIKQIFIVAFLAMTWGMVGCKSNEDNNKSTEEVVNKPEVKHTDTLSHESDKGSRARTVSGLLFS